MPNASKDEDLDDEHLEDEDLEEEAKLDEPKQASKSKGEGNLEA